MLPRPPAPTTPDRTRYTAATPHVHYQSIWRIRTDTLQLRLADLNTRAAECLGLRVGCGGSLSKG
jgi:hypothetical protein